MSKNKEENIQPITPQEIMEIMKKDTQPIASQKIIGIMKTQPVVHDIPNWMITKIVNQLIIDEWDETCAIISHYDILMMVIKEFNKININCHIDDISNLINIKVLKKIYKKYGWHIVVFSSIVYAFSKSEK